MKWVATTREGVEVSLGDCLVLAAIRVTEMDDVLVARMAWEGQILASLEKMLDFNSGISLMNAVAQKSAFSDVDHKEKVAYWDSLYDKVDF